MRPELRARLVVYSLAALFLYSVFGRLLAATYLGCPATAQYARVLEIHACGIFVCTPSPSFVYRYTGDEVVVGDCKSDVVKKDGFE